jgi:trigger factor
MQVDIEKLSPVLVEFQIQVPVDEVNSEVNAAYNKLKRTARVRGFRKGKAPRHILVQLYGPAIHADVAQKLMDSTLQKALSEKAIQPLTKPSVEPAELKPKRPFSFKARFEVRPDIENVDWKGLEATKKSTEVTDEQIDAELDKLRNEHATEEPVEGRAAKEGDLADLGLAFELSGEAQEEGIDGVEVGAGKILPFLDEALAGMKVGETKEVSGSFPDNHQLDKVRGQEATFKIELKELKQRVLPELDDEFAKDCEQDDLAGLKTHLRDQVLKRLEQANEEDLAKQLVSALCAKNPIPVPPSLVQQQAQMTARELQYMAQMSGQSMDDPNLQQRVMADSEVKVRAGLLMAEIAKEKEVKVTDEDIEKGYEELAAQTGKNINKIKVEYRERQKREMLIGMILEDKVLDLMEGAAKIEDA